MTPTLSDWLRGATRGQPRAPAGEIIYAIGDVHGCDALLAHMFAAIDADIADVRVRFPDATAVIVGLGDYIDRGPASPAVIDQLIARQSTPEPHIFIKGNHEHALLQFLNAATPQRASDFGMRWRRFGGAATLRAYGVREVPVTGPVAAWEAVRLEFLDLIPAEHVAFLRRLEPMAVRGDFVFVHAGVRPGVLLEEQSEDDLLWIRDDFLYDDGPLQKTVVHGHTPEMEPVHTRRRIGVDTGAYSTGVLTAVRLRGADVQFLQITDEAE